MAESSSGGEKTEQATPKRLQEARAEGQVSFSSELNIAALLLVSFAALAVMGPWFWQEMAAIMRRALSEAILWDLNDREAMRSLALLHLPALQWLAPFLGIVFATGIVMSVAQVGFQPSLKALAPKFERLNPITGLQRIFGLRGLMRFVFNFLKLLMITVIAWQLLKHDIPRMADVKPDAMQRIAAESWVLFLLAMKLSLVLAIIAAADFIYQRYQHSQDMMMTKQEVKEEAKQSEGDPHVKGKIRQIQRQMAQRRMMQEVPKADVVITNPTHVAVALKYDKNTMNAPVVLAKGYDAVAQKIKELAKEHNIIMVENISLARALAKEVKIGGAVPTKWYQAVAEVLGMVYKLKKSK